MGDVLCHPSQITGVVLAAGAGSRMGKPKLLMPYRGKPLLAWTLDLVERLPVERRLIVLGAQADEILDSLFSLPLDGGGLGRGCTTRHASPVTRHDRMWEILINERWKKGLGSSLRLAAEEVEGGMLLFLGDMPEVPEEAARAVLEEAGARPVAPSYRGRRGFPVYLPPSLRPRLLELSGDIGARDIIRGSCRLVPVDHPGVVFDIDEQADLESGLVGVGDEKDGAGRDRKAEGFG